MHIYLVYPLRQIFYAALAIVLDLIQRDIRDQEEIPDCLNRRRTMHMRMRSVNRTWLMAVLLAGVMAGCRRERAGTTTTTPPGAVVAPRVSSANPANLFDCEPTNRKITAALTKALDPFTINAATL